MRRLPGDRSESADVERMLRVNHAGEYGAARIYAGQLAYLKGGESRRLVEHMAQQEQAHLTAFESLMRERNVRPTALMPLWHVAGYALGAVTARLSDKAAFACTVAVESVIEEHYAAQEARLSEAEAHLRDTIARFRADEREHHDTSLEQGAEETRAYPALALAVKTASRLAIWLSTRI